MVPLHIESGRGGHCLIAYVGDILEIAKAGLHFRMWRSEYVTLGISTMPPLVLLSYSAMAKTLQAYSVLANNSIVLLSFSSS